MKKMILSLAVAGSMILATSACNSTKNLSGSADSTGTDSTSMSTPSSTAPVDTTTQQADTTRATTPPDSTKTLPPM